MIGGEVCRGWRWRTGLKSSVPYTARHIAARVVVSLGAVDGGRSLEEAQHHDEAQHNHRDGHHRHDGHYLWPPRLAVVSQRAAPMLGSLRAHPRPKVINGEVGLRQSALGVGIGSSKFRHQSAYDQVPLLIDLTRREEQRQSRSLVVTHVQRP